MNHDLSQLKDIVEAELRNLELPVSPANLYDPVRYILEIGGKRVRSSAVLLANKCFGGSQHQAMPGALAVEVFHNFTLMHDDIMDRAPLRRGKATVHEKWNTTIAILSGDAMMVKAYQLIEKVDPEYLIHVFKVFNKTALEVCEGQQFDMDFETSSSVTIPDYINMIRLKTAVLLAASLQIGAITAGASQEDQKLIYSFGENLGLAFQLQDDLLDCFADADKFGKQVGGDILDNKKTFLLLKANELASGAVKQRLQESIDFEGDKKVQSVLTVYTELGVPELTRNEINLYTSRALEALEKMSLSKEKLQPLYDLADVLLVRES